MKSSLRDGGLLIVTTRGPGKELHDYPADYWRFAKEDIAAAFSDFDVIALENDTGEPGVLFAGTKTDRVPPPLDAITPTSAPAKTSIQHRCQLVVCTPIPVVPDGRGGRGSR